ncbi:hypothetical protein WT72_17920 [Burkholderia pseudomultivorans]|nr:hypothetical protein WT72_17920 [Burkholderia pseudomultivorans]
MQGADTIEVSAARHHVLVGALTATIARAAGVLIDSLQRPAMYRIASLTLNAAIIVETAGPEALP